MAMQVIKPLEPQHLICGMFADVAQLNFWLLLTHQ